MSAAKKTSSKRKASKKSAKARRKRSVNRAAEKESELDQTLPMINEAELVLAWFRLLARRRGAWLQHLWVNQGSVDGHATVTHAELAGILADEDSPETEAEWSQNQEPVSAWRKQADEIKQTLDSLVDSRFARLARVFGLSEAELDLLRLCAAVAFDPALARVCAYLQDHSGRTYVTEELASRLLLTGRSSVWASEMNVYRWELVERHDVGVGEPRALICDAQIRDWLLEKNTLAEMLIGAASLVEPATSTLKEWPVNEIAAWIDESLQKEDPPCLRIVVVAPRGAGKRSFSFAVTKRLGMPLLGVDTDTLDDSHWLRFFVHVQRQAFLDAAALAWTGKSLSTRPWPANQAVFPIQFLLCEPGMELQQLDGVIDQVVQLPMPEAATRAELWRQSSSEAANWSEADLNHLAQHHKVWPGDISRAAQLGPRTAADAAYIIRQGARSRFGNLAQILECPFTFDDLVIPDGIKQLLEAIVFEAEERGTFWKQPEALRLFPQGRGLVALFSGPSGTGKTMAAQVIAARLTQDLCRVNVAQLVSKWVGETPKNVEQVIRVAAENNAVLFFDEADALFAKRAAEIRDAQDKFANTDTAFLLQAIESYPGIAILATNLKSNIDPAFLRRLRYLVEFPKPDAKLQHQLWEKLVTGLAGAQRAAALASTFDLFSTAIDATGAQIKYAVLGGLFAARADGQPLNARHLLSGMDRELGKEGRAIGPRERDRILKTGAAA